MIGMTNSERLDVGMAAGLLEGFTDTQGAAEALNRSRATVIDMVEKGLITRFRVGAAVLYWLPQIREVAAALRRLEVRDAVPMPENAGRAL